MFFYIAKKSRSFVSSIENITRLVKFNSHLPKLEYSHRSMWSQSNQSNKGFVACSQWVQSNRQLGNKDYSSVQHNIQCIYKGPLTSRIKMVKVLSLTSSLVGLLAQPLLMEAGLKIGGTVTAVFFCSCAGFFTFVTPVLLHFITKNYVAEIHYNESKDEYIATTTSIILYKIETKFKTSDIKVPPLPGIFTSIFVGKKPLFLDSSYFTEPEHYARIMGYNKPLDLKLYSNKKET